MICVVFRLSCPLLYFLSNMACLLSLENLPSAKYSSSAVSKLLNMQKMLLDLLCHKNSVLSYRRKTLFCLSCPGIVKKKKRVSFFMHIFLSFLTQNRNSSERRKGLLRVSWDWEWQKKDWRRRNLLLDARDLWSTRQELLWKPRESCWWCFFWETIIVSYEREVTKKCANLILMPFEKKNIFILKSKKRQIK